MSRVLVRVYAEGKHLDAIEIDIRKALATADAVEVDTEYISDAIGEVPNGDRSSVVAWADRVFPRSWGFHEDDIVIDRGGGEELNVRSDNAYQQFEQCFPRFAAFLESGAADPIEEISPPASAADLEAEEHALSIILPASYKAFLTTARCIRVQGGGFRMGSEHPFLHEFPSIDELPSRQRVTLIKSGKVWPPPSQGMLCFADFWLDGDGDQVLFDASGGLNNSEYPVYYYNHDQGTVRRLAEGFGEFIENVLR